MRIKITAKTGLIGDFLGMIPFIQHFAKDNKVYVEIEEQARPIYDLIPSHYNIEIWKGQEVDKEFFLDLHKAFAHSVKFNQYMSKCYFAMNNVASEVYPRAELKVSSNKWFIDFDYILSPFSNCLPTEQRLCKIEWQRLIDMHPDKKFCLIGAKNDDGKFITGENVYPLFGHPLDFVCLLLKEAKHGLISVVTGTSHLAFHLGVRNILLTNQTGAWGNNPEAIKITKHIPLLKAEDIKL